MNSETKAPDERMWAAAAHAAMVLIIILGFPVLGVIGAMFIWLFKRKTSSYVGYQALQAFLFQALVVFIGLLLLAISIPITIILFLCAIGYALYAAYRCYNGYDFRYAWLGNFIISMRTRR